MSQDGFLEWRNLIGPAEMVSSHVTMSLVLKYIKDFYLFFEAVGALPWNPRAKKLSKICYR